MSHLNPILWNNTGKQMHFCNHWGTFYHSCINNSATAKRRMISSIFVSNCWHPMFSQLSINSCQARKHEVTYNVSNISEDRRKQFKVLYRGEMYIIIHHTKNGFCHRNPKSIIEVSLGNFILKGTCFQWSFYWYN